MKKTSLRKNRFSARKTRVPDTSPKLKRGRKLERDVGQSRLEQLEFNDRDIVALIKGTMSRPISPEVQAFYDRMAALTRGKARTDGDLNPDLGDAA